MNSFSFYSSFAAMGFFDRLEAFASCKRPRVFDPVVSVRLRLAQSAARVR